MRLEKSTRQELAPKSQEFLSTDQPLKKTTASSTKVTRVPDREEKTTYVCVTSHQKWVCSLHIYFKDPLKNARSYTELLLTPARGTLCTEPTAGEQAHQSEQTPAAALAAAEREKGSDCRSPSNNGGR